MTLPRITSSFSSTLRLPLLITSMLKSPLQAEIAQLWSHRMQSTRFKLQKTAMERRLIVTNAKLDLRVGYQTALI